MGCAHLPDRRSRAALRLLVIAGVALSLLLPLAAAERPRVYALIGATVVPEPGRTIEAGTVVLRDGLIESVGKDVAIPADAVVLDASGRWIYAGLIDADSALGLEAAAPTRGGGAGSGGGASEKTPTGAGHPIERITSEKRAADRLKPFSGDGAREIEKLQELGFLAVLATPQKGLLRGNSAAILLATDRPVRELILRDDVAQHAAFERGGFGGGYPSSLMGAVAAVRQALLDAQRQSLWSARYSERPAGMNRPRINRALDALAPLLSGDQPLIWLTGSTEDSLLADRVADEFDLKLILSASGLEWEQAQRIAATGRSLIYPVAFPDKPKVKEDDVALGVTRQTMRRYLEAAAGPARLDEAGIEFAFTLRGMKGTSDFPKNVRKIIERGLPEEVALAALTTRPARMLGLESVLGSLAPGKIANVIVADGPLFGEETKVRQLFVDGRKREIEIKEKPKGDPDAIVDPRGEWAVVFEFGSRAIERAWTITGEKDDYSGTAETRAGTVTFDSVTLAGNVMTVVFPAREGRDSSEVTVIIEDDDFEGTMEMGPRSAEITGTRSGGPGGAR